MHISLLLIGSMGCSFCLRNAEDMRSGMPDMVHEKTQQVSSSPKAKVCEITCERVYVEKECVEARSLDYGSYV